MHTTEGEAGVSLIEMLIAVLVLSVGLLALIGTAVSTQISTTDARNRQQAVDAMSAAIEQARAYSYEALAMDSADVNVAADPYLTSDAGTPEFDHDAAGLEPAEALVVEAGGPISPYIDTGSRLTVRTYVTWYDPDDVGATDSKRVTAVATYVVGGDTKELRESTIVASANRGLAAPDFEVTPTAQSVVEQADQEVCFDHTLVNEGEQDKHSFTIQGWTDFVNWVQFTDAGGNVWEARAYIDGLQLQDATGDSRPDSQVFLPRGGTLPLSVCYLVPAGLADGSVFDWTVEIASQLDPSVVQTFTNTIEIGAPGTGPLSGFQLHFDPAQAAARTFVMDGVAPPVATEMVDLDGVDGIDGWRLLSSPSDVDNTTRWDWQYTGNGQVKLDGTATLQFYSAWDDALSGSSLPKQLEYELSLQVLDVDLNIIRTLATTTHTYLHTIDDWDLQTVNFDFTALGNAQRQVKKNEYVRLEMACRPNLGTDDCHIAFDRLVGGGPTYTSAIEIPGASS